MRGYVAALLPGSALIGSLIVCCLGLVAASANAGDPVTQTYPPVSVDVAAIQVSERVYYVRGMPGTATEFEGFVSNAGFVITDSGVVVFDALGTPSLAWELRKRIKELTDRPVVKVVVSHYHADHIYGLQVFKDEGAEIIAPDGVYEYLDSSGAAERLEERRFSLDPWVNERTRLVAPDRIIDQSQSFELGGVTFRLEYLGKAHSDGDLSMYVVEDRVLFSGDIIFEGRVPFVGNADTKRWLEALREMQGNELSALIPGHGPAARDPNAALRRTGEYLAYLREHMGAAVDELLPFAEAYDAVDWSRFEKLPAFEAANRRNAYQVYLSMETELLAQ